MTTQINVKVSEEELERWKRASTSAGRTLSEWLSTLLVASAMSANQRKLRLTRDGDRCDERAGKRLPGRDSRV